MSRPLWPGIENRLIGRDTSPENRFTLFAAAPEASVSEANVFIAGEALGRWSCAGKEKASHIKLANAMERLLQIIYNSLRVYLEIISNSNLDRLHSWLLAVAQEIPQQLHPGLFEKFCFNRHYLAYA